MPKVPHSAGARRRPPDLAPGMPLVLENGSQTDPRQVELPLLNDAEGWMVPGVPLPEELHGLYQVAKETHRLWTLRCVAPSCGRLYALVKPGESEDVKSGSLLSLVQHALGHSRPR